MARSHSRQHKRSGDSAISRAGSILHWVGMLAMVIGLFAPLATTNAAASVMSPEQALMKAAQQPFDRDTTDFDRVVLVGDFQEQVGCGNWDTNCDQTRLVNINGFWTGVFGVPPGSWNWELIAIDRFGIEYAVGDGQVNVSDGQAGIYAEFNSADRDHNVSATTGIAFATGSFGDVALQQNGDGYVANALNVSNPGWIDFQVTVNGEAVQTGAEFQQGVSRVSFDAVGNITDVEHRGFAEVTIQRMDANGNPLPGGCYVLDGSSQSRGCDTDGSPDGSGDGNTTLRFPGGFQPGDYTLRETQPADGAEPLADQTVNIQPGQSVIQARSAGEPEPETGDLTVLRQDQDFNLVGGATFDLVNTNGEVVASSGDTDNFDGRTDFSDIPAGDYTLRETTTPENVEPAGDVPVTVRPNEVTEQTLQTNTIPADEPPADEPDVDQPPADDPEADEPEIDEPEVDEPPVVDDRRGRIIIYRQDEFGTPLGGACYDAVNAEGVTVQSLCDHHGLVADDGTTGLPDLPLGEYTVVETVTPDGFQPADPLSVTVNEGDNEFVIQTAAVAADEPPVVEPPADEPEQDEPPADQPQGDEPDVDPAADESGASLEVHYAYDESQPVACVEVEATAVIGGMIVPYACDNGENDFNTEFGVIEMRGLEVGEFQVVPYEGPAYVVQTEPLPVTLSTDQVATVAFEQPEPETTSFAVQVTVDGENAVGEACFILDESQEQCDPSGRVTFTDVLPVDHTVRVTKLPQNYTYAEGVTDSQTVTVAADGSTVVSFQIRQQTGNVTVNTSDGTQNVGNVCYTLSATGEQLCDEGSGVTFEGVSVGDHSVAIGDVPANYTLTSEATLPVTVTTDGGSVTFSVQAATGNVTVTTSDGTQNIGNVCYTLSATGEQLCDEGSGVTFENVPVGDYTVTIGDVPTNYALTSEETLPVTVTTDGGSATFSVQAAAGNVTVTTSDGTQNIGNVCYTLSATGEQLCDEGSGVTFENVPVGDYTVTIGDVPANYSLTSEATLPVTVTTDGGSATFSVSLNTVDITVTTVDTETGQSVGGACYALGDDVVECDEEGTGQVVFEGQTPGEKTLSMETAPEGYQPVDDQTISADVNNVEVGVLQDTGSITVTVVDDATDTGLTGFCAQLGSAEEVCDIETPGSITFEPVATGEQVVTITGAPSGYDLPSEENLSQTVTVDSETAAQVIFRVSESEPLTGTLDVTVQFAGDPPTPVEGACVIVSHGESDFTAAGCDDNADGIVNFVDLPVGLYSVELNLDEYDGPALQEPIDEASGTVEADGENTATLNLQLAPTTGTLEITTLSDGILVEGACYTVAGIQYCDNETGDTNNTPGVVTIADLDEGTGIAVEMSRVPTGYQQPVAQSVDITAGSTTSLEFNLEADVVPGTVTVRTLDDNEDPLTNACYRLVQGSTIIGPVCDGDPADGDVEFDTVTPGTYRLQQTTRPSSNFGWAEDREVTVQAGQNTLVEVHMSLQPGQLRIITVDSADLTVRLQGACYGLEGNGLQLGPFCDSADGNLDGIVIFTNVPAGEYELRQTVSTAGFDPAPNRNVTINPNSSLQITVQNERVQPPAESGTLVVIPLAPNGEAVPGGCYQVFDGTTPVTHRVCDNADDQPARITFENLPVGELTLREVLAPSPDWQLAGDISVTIRNGETTTVEVPHEFKRGHVLIQAVNSVGLPLQGACFMLSDAGDMELCTDSTGQASVSGLVPGTRELTQTEAPFGFKLDDTPREVIVRPGQTTTVRVTFENEPPPNTGTVQVQKFFCPAGEEGERTRFMGGAQGNQELKQTAGCTPGVASFTLVAEDGSTESNAEFKTNEQGRAQLTAVEGIYLLTETDPDLPGNSAARIRVGVGQMTTVIVINYIAPPAPAPVTINIEGYTCPPGFNGSSFIDFANSCMAESQLTNQITVRAEAANRFKRVTGDTGALGKTAFTDLPAGTYSIWAQRPHNMPVTYLFCGADVNNPNLKTVNAAVTVSLESGSTILCRVFQVPPLFDAEHGAIQVHKFNCPINERQRGYDYQNECERPGEPIAFEIVHLAKTDGTQPQPVRISTNADGIVQFPMLVPGTYQLTEVEGEWCFAQSNSVDAQGNVVVKKNSLSEVWVYNCVGTKAPPNTGSGDAAGLFGPDGGIGPQQVLPNLVWPTALLAGWMFLRNRKHA